MDLLSLKSLMTSKVVWTGFLYLPCLVQKFEGVGCIISLCI